jgi:hypothetical protein
VLSAPADSDAPDLRPLRFNGPVEGTWALGRKLLAQPPRVVVIDDHHRLPAGEAVRRELAGDLGAIEELLRMGTARTRETAAGGAGSEN